MYSRCHGLLLVGAVIISVATMMSDIMKKPLGPKLCERLCNRIVGCKSYIYRSSDLFCHLTPSTLQNQENDIYLIKATKDKERMHVKNAVNCSEGDQIIRTRGHGIICRPILPNLPTLTNKEYVTDGRLTRILIMPDEPKKRRLGRQLYLANNSIVTYPFICGRKYQAMAYIPSQMMLVMSTKFPNNIVVFTPIDAKNETVVRIQSCITGIAIDDGKQLIFMKNVFPKDFVGVMKTHDKKQILLFEKSVSGQGGIVVDNKRFLIYLLYVAEVLQYTYQGIPKGRVAGIENAGGHLLYMQGDSLYHQTKSDELVQISLSDHSVTKLSTLKGLNILTLLKYGNLLYIIHENHNGKILVVNMSDMGNLTRLNMGFAVNARQKKKKKKVQILLSLI